MLSPEQCWQAVSRRDPAADGTFFYAVRTTGVYCRPGCASRLPRRANVAYFETAAAAEAAGFRPCKRCRPRATSPIAHHLAAVGKACRLIRESEKAPSLAMLARAAGVSRFHFHRLFKQITGVTPHEYAKTLRLNRFADTLDAGTRVGEAIYAAGYGAVSRAYESARTGLGMTPGAHRRRGRGQALRYVTAKSAIGWVLVGATERGICAAELGDAPEPLVQRLRERFPAAVLTGGDDRLRAWVEEILRVIATPTAAALDLPLDIQGTAFQAMVWRALQKIPPGTTASYAEIAAALGRPTAVRAVARACAANGVALLIPCHRVVRGDGALGGYRWGVERKRALLARERLGRGTVPQSLRRKVTWRRGS